MTEYDRVKVESVFVDQAKLGEASRQLLEEGGPQMWEAFMAELRSLHLGEPTPKRSVIRELTEAYLEALEEAGDEQTSVPGNMAE